jgi:hypothetical protein
MFSLFLKGIKENKQLFIRQIKDKKTEKNIFLCLLDSFIGKKR